MGVGFVTGRIVRERRKGALWGLAETTARGRFFVLVSCSGKSARVGRLAVALTWWKRVAHDNNVSDLRVLPGLFLKRERHLTVNQPSGDGRCVSFFVVSFVSVSIELFGFATRVSTELPQLSSRDGAAFCGGAFRTTAGFVDFMSLNVLLRDNSSRLVRTVVVLATVFANVETVGLLISSGFGRDFVAVEYGVVRAKAPSVCDSWFILTTDRFFVGNRGKSSLVLVLFSALCTPTFRKMSYVF